MGDSKGGGGGGKGATNRPNWTVKLLDTWRERNSAPWSDIRKATDSVPEGSVVVVVFGSQAPTRQRDVKELKSKTEAGVTEWWADYKDDEKGSVVKGYSGKVETKVLATNRPLWMPKRIKVHAVFVLKVPIKDRCTLFLEQLDRMANKKQEETSAEGGGKVSVTVYLNNNSPYNVPVATWMDKSWMSHRIPKELRRQLKEQKSGGQQTSSFSGKKRPSSSGGADIIEVSSGGDGSNRDEVNKAKIRRKDESTFREMFPFERDLEIPPCFAMMANVLLPDEVRAVVFEFNRLSREGPPAAIDITIPPLVNSVRLRQSRLAQAIMPAYIFARLFGVPEDMASDPRFVVGDGGGGGVGLFGSRPVEVGDLANLNAQGGGGDLWRGEDIYNEGVGGGGDLRNFVSGGVRDARELLSRPNPRYGGGGGGDFNEPMVQAPFPGEEIGDSGFRLEFGPGPQDEFVPRQMQQRQDIAPRQDFAPPQDFGPQQDFAPLQEFEPRQVPRQEFDFLGERGGGGGGGGGRGMQWGEREPPQEHQDQGFGPGDFRPRGMDSRSDPSFEGGPPLMDDGRGPPQPPAPPPTSVFSAERLQPLESHLRETGQDLKITIEGRMSPPRPRPHELAPPPQHRPAQEWKMPPRGEPEKRPLSPPRRQPPPPGPPLAASSLSAHFHDVARRKDMPPIYGGDMMLAWRVGGHSEATLARMLDKGGLRKTKNELRMALMKEMYGSSVEDIPREVNINEVVDETANYFFAKGGEPAPPPMERGPPPPRQQEPLPPRQQQGPPPQSQVRFRSPPRQSQQQPRPVPPPVSRGRSPSPPRQRSFQPRGRSRSRSPPPPRRNSPPRASAPAGAGGTQGWASEFSGRSANSSSSRPSNGNSVNFKSGFGTWKSYDDPPPSSRRSGEPSRPLPAPISTRRSPSPPGRQLYSSDTDRKSSSSSRPSASDLLLDGGRATLEDAQFHWTPLSVFTNARLQRGIPGRSGTGGVRLSRGEMPAVTAVVQRLMSHTKLSRPALEGLLRTRGLEAVEEAVADNLEPYRSALEAMEGGLTQEFVVGLVADFVAGRPA